MVLAACGDDDGPTDPGPSRGDVDATGTVDASGGTLTASDGSLTLTIPAGALTTATAMTVREIAPATLDFGTVVRSFDFEPDDLDFAGDVRPPSPSQSTCMRSDDPWGYPDLIVAFKVINQLPPSVVHRDEPCSYDVWTPHEVEILETFDGAILSGSWITINTKGGGPVWDECEGVYAEVEVTPSAPLDSPEPGVGLSYERESGYWFEACRLDRYTVECSDAGIEGVRLPRRAVAQYGSGIVDLSSGSEESEDVWIGLEQFRRIAARARDLEWTGDHGYRQVSPDVDAVGVRVVVGDDLSRAERGAEV